MHQALWAITRNTFIASLRQPIHLVLTLLGLGMLMLSPSLAAYSMEPGAGDNMMLVDIGLGNVFLIGMFLAAFTATGNLVQEIEHRTILTVITKPVPRPILLLGKTLGLSGSIGLACWTLIMALAMVLRYRVRQNDFDAWDFPVIVIGGLCLLAAVALATGGNYLKRKPYTSTLSLYLAAACTLATVLLAFIGKGWALQAPWTDLIADNGRIGQALVGSGLIVLSVWILTAWAVAFSTRLAQVGTLLACLGIFIAGVGLAPFRQSQASQLGLDRLAPPMEVLSALWQSDQNLGPKLAGSIAQAAGWFVPNLQVHWPTDALSRGNSLIHDETGLFNLDYIGMVTGYSLCHIVFALAIGTLLFQRREVS